MPPSETFEVKNLRKELEKELENTTGNIKWLYGFLTRHDLYQHLDIKKYLDSKSKLNNYINNLISVGVVKPPKKSGRSNRFEEEDILQLLLAARYMANGAIRENIAGHFNSFEINDYYTCLFSNTLPYSKEVIGKSKKSPIKNIKLSETNLFHQIRIGRGLTLQAKFHEYELDELNDMKKLLEDYITNKKAKS